MAKRVRATGAKNAFSGETVRHGRLVASVRSPRELHSVTRRTTGRNQLESTHMIPKALARAARIIREPLDFDDSGRRPAIQTGLARKRETVSRTLKRTPR